MTQQKLTKELFCKTDLYIKKLRKSDPIQFEVLFNEWKRSHNKGQI